MVELQDNQETTIKWREYLDMAWRYKWLIVMPALIGVILATVIAYSLPKVYRASTLILIEGQRMLNPLVEGLAVSANVTEQLDSLREEILSWPRLVELIEKLGLDKHVTSSSAYEALVTGLKKTIEVDLQKETIIQISYENQNPTHAQNVVRTISDILISRNLSSRKEEADDAIVFLENQLENYRLKLEQSEDDLRKFQEVYTVSLPVAARVNQQIVDLEIQLNMLLIECTESHPAVLALKQKIAELKGERDKELMKMESKGVDVSDPKFDEIRYSVPRQQQELARLQRNTKVNAAMYESFLQRLESARISKKLDDSDETTKFRVIEPPRLPITPFKPKKERIILLGLAIGLGLGCGIAFLLETSKTAFTSLEQAKKTLTLPVLGAISKIEINREMLKEMQKNQASGERIDTFINLVRDEMRHETSKTKRKKGLFGVFAHTGNLL